MIIIYHFSKKRSGFTLGSKLIMWAEDADYSHCATEIQIDPDSESFVYEAVFPKSRRLLKSVWLTHSEPVHSIPFLISDEKEAQLIIQELHDNLDKDYSIMQLVIIGTGLLFKAIDKAVYKLILFSNKSLICSEYQSKVLRIMGAKFEDPEDSIDCLECYQQATKLKGL